MYTIDYFPTIFVFICFFVLIFFIVNFLLNLKFRNTYISGTDGSQSAGISVVRVGHEGRPDDATDSESEEDKIPHVTLTVDSYYNEPNSIIKYGK